MDDRTTTSGTDAPFGSHAPNWFQSRIIALTRRQPDTWLGRRFAFAIRKLVTAGLKHPLDVEVFGAAMRLYPFNNVCDKRLLFTPQYFDADEFRVLRDAYCDGFVFVDVGANVGGYTLYVAGLGNRGVRVLAIEPQPVVIDRLLFNVACNPGNHITVATCAIADRDGTATLFLDPDNQGGSSLKTLRADPAETGVEVPMKTLLGLVREQGLDHIDALKLDTEGSEDLILVSFLRDAPESLWPRLVIIEQSSGRWQTDCRELLRSKGYALRLTTRLNFVMERTPD